MAPSARGFVIQLVLVVLVFPLTAAAGNSGLTFQGRILKPDGSPLSGQYAQFKLQVRTPDAASCLMYEEIQTLDMRDTKGAFGLTINDGSVSRTDSSGLAMERIFANTGTFTLDPATCSSGAGTYTPGANDARDLVVLFKDETMTTWEPIPAQRINSVPTAIDSKQIAGFGADSLLRVVNGSGDPLTGLSPLSNAQYTELLALVDGTSTAFTKANQLAGVALPSMNSGEVLGWNGSAWVSQPTAVGPNSVTTAMIQNNAVDSTKIASGAVGTSQIAANVSISTSGTLTSAVTTTRDFKIYAASPSTFYVDMQAPALAASYSLVWPLDDGANGEVLTTNGSGVLTWAPAAAPSQWTTHGTHISFDGAGNVGIGTTSPASPLDVYRSVASGTLTAANFMVESPTTANQTIGVMRGLSAGAYNQGTGTTTATTVRGGYLWAESDAGTVTNLDGAMLITSQGGDATNVSGLSIRADKWGGNTTNRWGIYINAPQGSATNDYGIYVQGLQKNYFAGNVGIGTTAPAAKLDVTGQIHTTVYNAGSSVAIDWNNGNNQYTSPAGGACTAIALTNLLDGGSYTLAAQGVTSGTCTFSQAGLTFVFSPSNTGVTTDAVYTFLRMGSTVYVSWTTNFQ